MKPKLFHLLKRLTLAVGLLLFAGVLQVAVADVCDPNDPDFDRIAAADPTICPPPDGDTLTGCPPEDPLCEGIDGTDIDGGLTDTACPSEDPLCEGFDGTDGDFTTTVCPPEDPLCEGIDGTGIDGGLTDTACPPEDPLCEGIDGTDIDGGLTDTACPSEDPLCEGFDGTGIAQPISGTCRENPLDGVFCDAFNNPICIPKAAINQPAACTRIPGICIENPGKGLYCDEFGKQLCFPNAELGIKCDCKEEPARGLYCSASGRQLCEERPAEGMFCYQVPPSCIHDPDNGLFCDVNHRQKYEIECVPDSAAGISCSADGQTCITFDGQEICENDFNMMGVDLNNFSSESLRFIDDEAEMEQLPADFFRTLTGDDFSHFRSDSFSYMSSEQIAQLPPEVFEGIDGFGLVFFDPAVFDDFTPAQLERLPGESFAGVTATQFNRMGESNLQSLSREQVRHVPRDVWSSIDDDMFFHLPPEAFDGLDSDACESLPPSVFNRLDSANMGYLNSDCLMGMEDEDFMLLPEDALAGLNERNLVGLPPHVLNDFTPKKFKKLSPEALRQLSKDHPFKMLEIIANLGTTTDGLTSVSYIDLVMDYLPPGFEFDLETGELMFSDDLDYAGGLPFPEFEVNENDLFGDLAGRISYAPPMDIGKGFGLGGAGRKGMELLDEAITLLFPGFKFKQNAEGFIKLEGEGEFAGVKFDLVLINSKRAPRGALPNNVEVDPITDAFIVTTSNGMQFEFALGAPSVTCLAKGMANHDLEYTNEHVAIFKPKASADSTTTRREDIGSHPTPISTGGGKKGRRATQSAGLSIFPATQVGERPYGELSYGDEVDDPDCAGYIQTVYPALPNASQFIELLTSFGFAKEDLFRHVNGGVRILFDVDGDGNKERFEVVPDFPTESPNIARGKVEQQRLMQNADGSFVLDSQGRFLYKYPYAGKLLTIPLALLVITD